MKWSSIVTREFRQIFVKDPRLIGIIFAASIAYLLLFSMLYGTHVVKYVPLAIYDEDQTPMSRALIQAFADSEKFQIVAQPADEIEMKEMLKDHTVYGAIQIQSGFSREISAGRASPFLFIASGVNLVVTNIATTAAQEVTATFAQATSSRLAETAGLSPALAAGKTAPVQAMLRVYNNPILSYLNFFVIGLAMAAFQQGVFLPVGASIIGEYQKLSELAPFSAWKVIGLKMLPYFLLDTISFFLTLFISVKVFAIPCKGDLLSLFALSTAFVITAIGFGSLVSSFCKSEITFTKFCLIYAVPAFTLSGYLWPLMATDTFSQTIACIFPLFYFADSLRELLLSGYSPLLVRNVFVMYLFGLGMIGLSAAVFARKRQKLLVQEQPEIGMDLELPS